MSARVPLRWTLAEPPALADAVVAEGAVASRLALRLLEEPASALALLRGVCAPGLLIVLGAREALPWVDGVRYLARLSEAPALYAPAWLAPTLPPVLVALALARAYGAGPHVVLPGDAGAHVAAQRAATPGDATQVIAPAATRVIALGAARAIAADTLAAWLDDEASARGAAS